ncbi:cyclopropane-fatty-acyl-phospholipid synthase family protein [Motiliproteus sp. SC1-56]|uniref:SAM-dependent methyltransferase n=1 Tax=Motiliproteus sp. SC1-56 TaxID=2799565 RepID=UPI001A90C44D|nr:cyclopropane-fatty-acyl-phospholipid synthase family protein [Motiliproteus sp. SC1-56]
MKQRLSESEAAVNLTVPSAPARRLPLLYRALISRLEQAEVSRLRLVLPDGRELALGQTRDGVPLPRLRIRRAKALLRGWFGGLTGWAEGFMADDWACDDLVALTDWAMANEAALDRAFAGSWLATAVNRLLHRLNANTRRGSRRNIAYHYDLGNDFYRLWLDPSMTYSSALFATPDEPLELAQQRKYRRILQLLAPQPRDRVLEIGCGWGGFGEALLRDHDSHWYGVTLSQEQLAWSRERLASFGERARCSLTDYRDLQQRYDGIVSIEMLEAVGEANWPLYFQRLRQLLKPGGRAVVQVITIDDARFETYRRGSDFIQRYIFPGGMLPSPSRMREQIQGAGLRLLHEEGFGADYARTLAHWHRAFVEAWPRIRKQGFDERFYRLWRYYLAYCESGFRAGSIDVRLYQIGTES